MSFFTTFFDSLMPALWSFFQIPFPLFGLTVLQVCIACALIGVTFMVIKFLIGRREE